jgi:ParB family chromosome partitioning protein
VENIQREDLNPMDLARSYRELIEVHGLTHEELSGIVHKSRSQISNTLRLLALDDYVGEKVAEGKITQGHAKILVSLPPREQRIVADTVIGRRLSVRETERLVQNGKKSARSSKKRDDIFRLDEEAKELLGEILSPFRHKIGKKSVELIFESESEYEKFVSFMKKRS